MASRLIPRSRNLRACRPMALGAGALPSANPEAPRGEPPKWRPRSFREGWQPPWAPSRCMPTRAARLGRQWRRAPAHTIARLASMSRREAIESIHRLEQRLLGAGWMTVQRRPRLSSVYRPKRPQDELCQGCWFVLHRDAKGCPSCGLETGVRSAHLGVQGVHPKLYRNTKGISSMKEDQNLSLLKTLSPGELNDASCDLRRPR